LIHFLNLVIIWIKIKHKLVAMKTDFILNTTRYVNHQKTLDFLHVICYILNFYNEGYYLNRRLNNFRNIKILHKYISIQRKD
jgi:hypothetical protein